MPSVKSIRLDAAIQVKPFPCRKGLFLFQPHTEWISKGKAGVPVELGLRVCIMEDSHGFILHSQVCKTTDDKVAVPMVAATKAQFPVLMPVVLTKASTVRTIKKI
jgi:hypothetical protein